ncbi:endonuclease III [Ligilactobacillus salitolerans]|uniref:Endonuclease III n=1 Tax=Ligilactobacillus salitolerans TaxID=1808352 RepID=A0A401IVN2_9LACO|nr:endonuclease III [Ligilactobacillus salitolerans]GBG95547.1 endonuclease III [Ligilactobacillus salitolerans]
MKKEKLTLSQLYYLLSNHLGPQRWWPADSVPEMLCGMILVQNTNWNSAERSLQNLRETVGFDLQRLLALPRVQLEKLIQPSGFYHAKADYLRNILTMYQQDYPALRSLPTAQLRKKLLSIKGIGNETADVLLLYLFDRPVFVADTYARQLFFALTQIKDSYPGLKIKVERSSHFTVLEAQEFHALIDEYSKLADDPLGLKTNYQLKF